MKKVITAINNPKLNEKLKKEKNFKVIGKDIQYKEAILEILEKNHLVDLIILSEKIPGQIKFEKLIEKIKIINKEIKIIFILEKENNELEKILLKNNILDIYYNNKINLNELIKIINKKEINMEEEIIKLKKIIEKGGEEYHKRDFKRKENFREKIKSIIKKQEKKKEINETKVITVYGNYKSGKSTISLIISKYLSEENNKVLLIDGDLEKQDLSVILKKNKKSNNEKAKNKILNRKKIKHNKLNNNYKKLKNKNYNIKIKNKINLNIIKINKNLEFYYGLNDYLKNKLKIKKLIIQFLTFIKPNYNFIIFDLSKNNFEKINKTILKCSDKNFLVIEPNILGIREIQKNLKMCLRRWSINPKNLYFISNKKNKDSINKNLILKSFPIKNKIIEIRENKYYKSILNSQNIKRKKISKNNMIKKEINKIIKIIVIKKRKKG